MTLDPDILSLLHELADASGLSVSAFVTQVFRHSLPQMKAVSDAHRLAHTDPARASRLLLDALDDSESKVNEMSNKIKDKAALRPAKKAG